VVLRLEISLLRVFVTRVVVIWEPGRAPDQPSCGSQCALQQAKDSNGGITLRKLPPHDRKLHLAQTANIRRRRRQGGFTGHITHTIHTSSNHAHDVRQAIRKAWSQWGS
jgi:hypothetical protein